MTGLVIDLASQAETEALAERLSLWARPGLLIALDGALGSGKSTFARAFIRKLFKPGDESDVPSPSFSLVQSYDETRVPLFHADLYRTSHAAEISELGLEDMLTSHMGLVEWANRLERPLSDNTLAIALSGRGNIRQANITAGGAWQAILARDELIRSFLDRHALAKAERVFFEGDASSRRYERIVAADGSDCLLMDMPQRPDGPPVKNGKPYSAVAHLAEGLTAVVAVNTHLVGLGYSAPRILKHDLASGLALIEPLGDKVYGRMMLAGDDMREPMMTAAALLADMTRHTWPRHPLAEAGVSHQVADYDAEALLIEADLLPVWFHKHAKGTEGSDELRQSFAAVWSGLLPLAVADQLVWVMRDYHSPNLIWIPEREGLKRVGLIDTQDAVMGHPAYDLMSMVQDARVDVDFDFGDSLVAHYCALRHAQGRFDESGFRTAFAVLGAQRATKILGIFARLKMRDGKPHYIRHMPRVSRYLARNLAHPALASLKQWYDTHLPEALAVGRT